MTQIKAISFDLDNTLWHAEPVLLEAEKAMAAWISENAPKAVGKLDKSSVINYKRQLLSEFPGLIHQVSEIRKRLLFIAMKEAGYDASQSAAMSAQAFDVFYQARQKVELFEPVIPALETLSEQYRMISITNGNSNPETIGLSRYFEFSMSAESEGIGKPAADIFQRALARLELLPDEVVHVGDHLEDDVAGAAAVGMKTVWMNLHNVVQPPTDIMPDLDVVPDAVITCISQLRSTIQRFVAS